MSQCDNVLKKLRKGGKRGVHSFVLYRSGVCGIRPAARVQDLQDQGYEILSVREKLGHAWGCRYFLMDYK